MKPIRGYLLSGTRGVYVDVPSVHFPVDDFTSPHIEHHMNITRDIVHKEDIILLGDGTEFVVYWTEHVDDPISTTLLLQVDEVFHGRILVFKRREHGRRLVNLRKGDNKRALKVLSW